MKDTQSCYLDKRRLQIFNKRVQKLWPTFGEKKSIYIYSVIYPYFQLFYFNERLE